MSARLGKGLFPSERTVEFEDADGRLNAVIADAGQVNEICQTVRVMVLDVNDEHALVQVPAKGAGDQCITSRINKKLLVPSPLTRRPS